MAAVRYRRARNCSGAKPASLISARKVPRLTGLWLGTDSVWCLAALYGMMCFRFGGPAESLLCRRLGPLGRPAALAVLALCGDLH